MNHTVTGAAKPTSPATMNRGCHPDHYRRSITHKYLTSLRRFSKQQVTSYNPLSNICHYLNGYEVTQLAAVNSYWYQICHHPYSLLHTVFVFTKHAVKELSNFIFTYRYARHISIEGVLARSVLRNLRVCRSLRTLRCDYDELPNVLSDNDDDNTSKRRYQVSLNVAGGHIISHNQSLEVLYLTGDGKIHLDALALICASCPNLKDLRVDCSEYFGTPNKASQSDNDNAPISSPVTSPCEYIGQLMNLQSLQLPLRYTTNELQYLAPLCQLQSLTLHLHRIGLHLDQDFHLLSVHLIHLKTLILHCNQYLGLYANLSAIAFPSLTHLAISGTAFGDYSDAAAKERNDAVHDHHERDMNTGSITSFIRSSPLHQQLTSLTISSGVTLTTHSIQLLRNCFSVTDLQIMNVYAPTVSFDDIISLCESMKYLLRLTLHANSYGSEVLVPARMSELIPAIHQTQRLFLLCRRELTHDVLYHAAVSLASLPQLQVLTCDCIDRSAFHNQRRRLDLPRVEANVNVRMVDSRRVSPFAPSSSSPSS